MKSTLAVLAVALAAVLLLNGCVAVWGKGHNVVFANSEGMLIQYDPLIASPGSMAGIAQQEASKYGRVIVPGDFEPSNYGGIHQRYFKFITPTPAGRQNY